MSMERVGRWGLAVPFGTLAISLAVLAGCGSPTPRSSSTTSTPAGSSPTSSTPPTGSIIGLDFGSGGPATSSGIYPIRYALVSVRGQGIDRTVTASKSGAFAFTRLPSGTYVLQGLSGCHAQKTVVVPARVTVHANIVCPAT